jgi:transcriptional regulator with XRE-family HTH domain
MAPREETVGARIRALRERAGLTQAVLAAMVGVSVGQVSRWETNRTEPALSNLAALAPALGVSADTILGLAPMLPSKG